MTKSNVSLAPLNEGMTEETAREFLIFVSIFKAYEDDIEGLSSRIAWYFEQYYQMCESGEELNFMKWLNATMEMHEDINIEHKEHISSLV
jgi:hypothetical protein